MAPIGNVDHTEPQDRQVQLSWEGDQVKLEVLGSEPVDETLAGVICSVRRQMEMKSSFIDSKGQPFKVLPGTIDQTVLHELSGTLTEQANKLLTVIAR